MQGEKILVNLLNGGQPMWPHELRHHLELVVAGRLCVTAIAAVAGRARQRQVSRDGQRGAPAALRW